MVMTRDKRGFSLVEILVTLVILAVGVLTLMRAFPIVLRGLGVTNDYTVAQILARREVDRLKGVADDLPEQILPVSYQFQLINGNWTLIIFSDPNVSPDDLGAGGNILEDGNIEIVNPGGSNTLIYWRYYNDANRIRRVIGEGGRIPAPRPVGNDFGSLRVLQFGPVVNDPNLLLVFSSDMEERDTRGTSPGEPIRNPRPWQFVVDNEVPQVWLPGDGNRVQVWYRLSFSYWANVGGNVRRVDVVDVVVPVRTGVEYDAVNNEVTPFDLVQLAGNPPNWIEFDFGSLRVNRLFDPIPNAQPFDPNYPYEYKVLNGELGLLLFNPAGYNFRERRGRGRVPLQAHVNYDVYNWHIIRDTLRIDRTRAPIHKLTLRRLKAFNDILNDKRRYPGLEMPVPDGNGGVATDRDVIVLDLDTGGIVSPRVDPSDPNSPLCYKVDYLRGTISFGSPLRPAPTSADDLARSVTIILPGDPANPALLRNVDPGGRNFRVLYQAHNDWALQVLKASQNYRIAFDPALGVGQCYVGQTPGNAFGLPTRIYFPRADIGNKVSVREIWYRGFGGAVRVMRDQDFLVRPVPAGDPLPGLAYIDIREVDASATGFDWSTHGFAVRGVSGSSLKARAMWNTEAKQDVPGNGAQQIQERMDLHRLWTSAWRSVEVETYLTRRDEN